MPAFTPGLAGLTYADLFTLDGLTRLDNEYLKRLQAQNPAQHDLLLAVRQGKTLSPIENSELLLACAPLLDDVIGDLFGIRKELTATRTATLSHNPVFTFKKLFVLRRARRRLIKKEEFESFAELDEFHVRPVGLRERHSPAIGERPGWGKLDEELERPVLDEPRRAEAALPRLCGPRRTSSGALPPRPHPQRARL